jgi:hypothetical protein
MPATLFPSAQPELTVGQEVWWLEDTLLYRTSVVEVIRFPALEGPNPDAEICEPAYRVSIYRACEPAFATRYKLFVYPDDRSMLIERLQSERDRFDQYARDVDREPGDPGEQTHGLV